MPTADPEPRPPGGVRIERADGAVISCEVRRADPPYDDGGCAAWIAIPADREARMQPGDHLRADILPEGAALRVRFGRSPDVTP